MCFALLPRILLFINLTVFPLFIYLVVYTIHFQIFLRSISGLLTAFDSLFSPNLPGPCRKLLLCRGFPRWHPKTGEDEHVRESSGYLGSSQGRHSWKASKHGPGKGSVRLPNNVDRGALRFLISEVQHEEDSENCRDSTRGQASEEL